MFGRIAANLLLFKLLGVVLRNLALDVILAVGDWKNLLVSSKLLVLLLDSLGAYGKR